MSFTFFAISLHLVKVAAAGLGLIHVPVNFIGFQQPFMGVKAADPAVVQHQNPVCFRHAGHPLGDDELGGVGNLLGKGGADFSVGGGVHCGGGVV